MDTIVRGIPMPIIFLRQRTDPDTLEPRREVVDGQQRLRTVIAFIDPNLLPNFDAMRDAFTVEEIHNEELAGKSFRELPAEIRQRVLDYDFSVHVLPADTEDRDVLLIFGRMNSTGFKLNEQELRNAEFFGAYKELMYQLAYEQLDRWRSWGVFSETDIARMLEVEEASDITITMLKGVHGKNQREITEFYKKYNKAFPQRLEVMRRFRAVMDTIQDHLGPRMRSLAFRRKPLFHTLFSFYYDLTFGLGSPMVRKKPASAPKTAAIAVVNASTRIASDEIPEDLAKVLR
jgi:hypothetical protein